MVEADRGLSVEGTTGVPGFDGRFSLPPEVPADMLGALLGGWLGGRLEGRDGGLLWSAQSLSEIVGEEVDDATETGFLLRASFCSVPRVCPGCLSEEMPASGGGRGMAGCDDSFAGEGLVTEAPARLRAAFRWLDMPVMLLFP